MSVPYGLKNSLSEFIRALETALGDVVNNYVITSWMTSLFIYQASLIT